MSLTGWHIPRGSRLRLTAAVGLAMITGACEPAAPQRQHLDETNKLVVDRTSQSFDSAQLLKFDVNARAGETAPVGVLTLDDAVSRCLRYNYSLVAAAENLTVARAQVAQASLIQNPTLAQSSGLLFPFYAHALPSFDINISQTINSILTQPARVRVARLNELQAQIDLASAAFTLSQSAQSKYQELSHIVRSRRIAERVVDVYDRAVRAAEARQQVGLIPMPELNRARLNYTDAVRQVQHLKTQYARAAQEMNWLMGYSTPPGWRLPEEELAPPAQLPPPPGIESLENLGMTYRLDLLRADYDRQLGDYGVRLARAGLFPELTVGGEFARDNSKHWAGGPFFSLSLPIFDPGLVALALAEDNQRKANKTYLALQGQVRQDVQTAVANYQIAEDDLHFFREKIIPQQEQNVKLMQESFRLGNDDLDALLNTLRDYVTTQQSFEDSTQAYQAASTALQAAVGASWDRFNAAAATQPAIAPSAKSQPASTQPSNGGASAPRQ